MAITSNQQAKLTLRLGCGRLGNIRLGFVPKDVKGKEPGSMPKCYYRWAREERAASTWTTVKS